LGIIEKLCFVALKLTFLIEVRIFVAVSKNIPKEDSNYYQKKGKLSRLITSSIPPVLTLDWIIAAAKVTVAKSRLKLAKLSSFTRTIRGARKRLMKPLRRENSSKRKKEAVMIMTLTRDFKETVSARVQRDPEFAAALLDEAISLFLSGEPETARLILRDLSKCNRRF
jgi:hypothetical protein